MTVVRFLWLATMWVMLWGGLTWANALSGAVVAGAVLALFTSTRSEAMVLRPLAAVKFAFYFAYKLVESTVVVTREIMTPENDLRRAIIAVPLHTRSRGLSTLVANAISLTPGTLTLEVQNEPMTLYVHVLHLHDPERVRRDIRRLETLAVRAFGTADAVAALRDGAEVAR